MRMSQGRRGCRSPPACRSRERPCHGKRTEGALSAGIGATQRRRIKRGQPTQGRMPCAQLRLDGDRTIRLPTVIFTQRGLWQAAQQHARGPTHCRRGDAGEQALENSAGGATSLPASDTLRQMLKHLQCCRMKPPPATQCEGVIFHPSSSEFLAIGLHTLALARVHGHRTVASSACSRR